MTQVSISQKTSQPLTTSSREEREEEWREEIRERDRVNRLAAGQIWLGGEKPFEEMTFASFNPDLNGTHRYLDLVRKFDIRKGNLFLLGPVGTGKTHLMTAKAHDVFDAGGRVRIFNAESFPLFIRKNKDWLALLCALDFIGFDDIDEFPMWKSVARPIKITIQERDAHKRNGMFIACNKPLATLGEILGGKIQDRIDGLFQNIVIPENTPSVRGILKRAKKSGK